MIIVGKARNTTLKTPNGDTFDVDGDVVLVGRNTGERRVWIVHKADLSPILADGDTTLEEAIEQTPALGRVGVVTQAELGEAERAGGHYPAHKRLTDLYGAGLARRAECLVEARIWMSGYV